MRPDKSVAKQSDWRDLKKLWEQLGEEPPGEPTSLERNSAERSGGSATQPTPSSS